MRRGVQKTSFKGISERGSARISARVPWQTAGGDERRESSLSLPRRRQAGDFSRRERATRPEKDVFERPASTRGYQKIEGAIRAFNFDFRGKTVLDIGSSTGGFTEAALNHGAKKVIAVEKGSHQMKAPLRFDSRIDLHEKTDIFDVMFKDTPPDVIVADVSFVSLRPILKHARDYLSDKHTEFLMMLKPQFEAYPNQLSKGIVKNERFRRDIIKDFEAWLKRNNFIIIKKRDNDLKGKKGNTERFYWLKQPEK